MNPFLAGKKIEAHGAKSNFYYDQFCNVEIGDENAVEIKIHEGDENQTARMYLNKFKDRNGMKFKTTVSNGSLWVSRIS